MPAPRGRTGTSRNTRGGGSARSGSSRPGGFRRNSGGDSAGGRFMRKKINRFYTVFSERATVIDYKDVERLTKFLTEKGKILPRRISGLTAKQQRMLTRAIKQSRHAGLIAFQID